MDAVDAMGESKTYPDFMTRFVEADPAYINKRIGVNIEARYVLHLQIPPHFLPIQD